ncbi:MAG: DUF1926 domain-containing protein [Candidatus Lokiarchaeota archaeon]|nr:DUF1926 domain-containing protein [Candidatus Lokiarchaeota archaeon]MBD3199816.1 DUF1926 domain-containing protein [Candidatus Lokiarchaeota archaeon]
MDILIESNLMNLYSNPSEGGTIFEMDYKPKSYNLLNTLSRWEEAYHEKAKIENGEIFVDKFRKSMLRLYLFPRNEEKRYLKDLKSNKYIELGDFINGEFDIIRDEKEGEKAILELKREGSIKLPNHSEESF